MDGKGGGWDLTDLEKEINSAVDNLLVKKNDSINPATLSQTEPSKNNPPFKDTVATPKTLPSAPGAHMKESTTRELQEKLATFKPSISPSVVQKPQQIPGDLKNKLEEVEAQLLTLEWDINSKHINTAITHLQDLRKYSHLGNELVKVVALIQKVLYQLILDESKLSPSALKFLQKSWKAVKGMTDERFSMEIDKDTLVRELVSEFQRLKIEDNAADVPTESRETRRSFGESIVPSDERAIEKSLLDAHISFTEIDRFMNKLEKLVQVVNEEQKRWKEIHQEIINFKADLQQKFKSMREMDKELHDERKTVLDGRSGAVSDRPSGLELQQMASASVIAVSLCKISGVIFAVPERQIVRIFPTKKWVSDSFIERGKVKLKNREIPLFNIPKVFKLRPSSEENPLVLLIKGREDRPAAVIIDQAIGREEIEYQPLEGRPYIFGQGISPRGKVWILDAEQISP